MVTKEEFNMEDLEESELEYISEQVKEGYTSGRFEGDKGNHIYWELKYNVWEDYMSMQTYTQWYIQFPWHVSGDKEYQYPKDDHGDCTCQCEYCKKMGAHKATRKAHTQA
jgi:hypothetical protein